MSYQRISASTKDTIKKYYSVKIGEINSKIEEVGKKLAEVKVRELEEEPKYQAFKKSIIDFCNWLKEVDSENNFSDTYSLERTKDYFKDDTFFKTPYRSSLEKIFSNDIVIQDLVNQKSVLTKECNKLLWNLEMSPKSSQEYKDALAKAESLLFNGDKNEE